MAIFDEVAALISASPEARLLHAEIEQHVDNLSKDVLYVFPTKTRADEMFFDVAKNSLSSDINVHNRTIRLYDESTIHMQPIAALSTYLKGRRFKNIIFV